MTGWLLLGAAVVICGGVYLADGRARMRRALTTVDRVIDERGTAVQDAPDPVDEHFYTAAAVLQPDLDITFADQVEAWLHRRTPTIRNATPDKEA